MRRRLPTALAALAFLVGGGACSDPDAGRAAPPTPGSGTRAATTSTTLAPCPAVAPRPAVVTRFHGPDGRCLPVSRATIYRCTPEAPVPVAVVDGRRFLGGPHAAAVLPNPTATVVGRAADGTVLSIDPADPGGVLVSTLIGADRWPAVPLQVDRTGRLVEGSARPAVFVVGDSVILGAAPEIAAAFADWTVTLDAVVSRSTAAGLDVLRARRSELGDIVVVALGYNDGADVGAWATVAGQVLDELATVPLVVWVGLREVRPYYVEDNAVLRQLAAGRANVVVADWWAASASVPASEFASDGLHLRPVAAQAMAGLLAGVIRPWYAAHPDQGDQSCRPTVDAAVLAAAGAAG